MSRATEHGFMTEAEVVETWPMIPATAIRRARRNGDLPYYHFVGGPHYRLEDVEAFIERKYRRGPPSATKSLARVAAPPTSMPVDMQKPTPPISPRVGAQAVRAKEIERLRADVAATEIEKLSARKQRTSAAAGRKPGRPRKGL